MMIILLATAYVGNTIAELADMIGVITLHPSGNNGSALFFISGNLGGQRSDLLFAVLANRSGRPLPSSKRLEGKAGLGLSATGETGSLHWRPLFLDYLYLGYNTATAFSPTDALPLTRRAKMLMMIESTISLLTMVIILSRAINILPS